MTAPTLDERIAALELICEAYGAKKFGYREFLSVIRELKAELATKRIPDGWQLVPMEPTQAMLDNGNHAEEVDNYTLYCRVRKSTWKSMLAAAPKPEAKP